MRISEKQIMQLISICRSLAEELIRSDDAEDEMRGKQLEHLLLEIIDQQSEELKVIQ